MVSEQSLFSQNHIVSYFEMELFIHIFLFCTPPQSDRSPAIFYFYINFLSREILTGRAASQQNTEAVFLVRIRDVLKKKNIKLLPTPTWSSEGVKYNSKSQF